MDRSVITELAKGTYIDKGEAILVSGASGAGKSFLIAALGHQACAQGYKGIALKSIERRIRYQQKSAG